MVAVRPIAIFHHHGTYYALDNACPHYGKPLAAGQVQGTTVTCIWHGAVFDLCTGAVVTGPAPHGVRSYPVRVVGTAIYLEMPEAAEVGISGA
jgi:nitrite reductase/ring-hydroxylating ferredoxin subunit